ncbi:hypothetical protein M0R45_016990 [Rubus argutus]|uniref:Uncharacterized protein n=1 Tax=Rubus argutus TaxID=59490 RepID=A0AAW1XXQ9_RUBAR
MVTWREVARLIFARRKMAKVEKTKRDTSGKEKRRKRRGRESQQTGESNRRQSRERRPSQLTESSGHSLVGPVFGTLPARTATFSPFPPPIRRRPAD